VRSPREKSGGVLSWEARQAGDGREAKPAPPNLQSGSDSCPVRVKLIGPVRTPDHRGAASR